MNRIIFLSTIAAALSLAACSSSLQAGDQLVGQWSSNNSYLSAVSDSVVFRQPCEAAVFDPITLDANKSFSVVSNSYSQFGNAMHAPGDELHLQGQVSGNNLVLTFFVVHVLPPNSDPVTLTLSKVSALPAPVCSA